jgi:hypothetical protein
MMMTRTPEEMKKESLDLVRDMLIVSAEYGFQTEFKDAIFSRNVPDEVEFMGWVSLEFIRLSRENQVPGTEERGAV